MSWENVKDAYRTRLGSAVAKEVLALVVDEANAEGLAFVGIERIACLTEVKKRTVLRILQVFGLIGLVSRTEAMLKGRVVPAIQIDLAMLGTDLRAAYAGVYSGVQGKVFGVCRSDADESVAATRKSVAATRKSVAATQPPRPLIGVSPLFPLMSPTPVAPVNGGTSDLRIATGHAADQVCSALGIANRRKRKVVEVAIALAAEKGEPPPTLALAMIEAVREQDKLHLRRHLKFKFGLQKFIGEGIWRDRNRWAWDPAEMRLQAEARVGG